MPTGYPTSHVSPNRLLFPKASFFLTSTYLWSRSQRHDKVRISLQVSLFRQWIRLTKFKFKKNVSYDPVTGKGGLGVEFAGTAVTSSSSFGNNITPTAADAISRVLVANNTDLQWSEGSYRGFFLLDVSPSILTATYFAMRNISELSILPCGLAYQSKSSYLGSPNLDGFASAHFVVERGEFRLTCFLIICASCSAQAQIDCLVLSRAAL
jgi:PhoD-like phosphatase